MDSIILNIGIENTESTRELTSCAVRLYRVPKETDPTRYDIEENTGQEPDGGHDAVEEMLEATGMPFVNETWQSGNASVAMECLCVALEIDPAWRGEVRLVVITDHGRFETQVYLHQGLNSFFLSAAKMLPLKKEVSSISKVIKWGVCLLAAVGIGVAIWAVARALNGDTQPAQATDSITDSIIESTAIETATDAQPIEQDTEAGAAMGSYGVPAGGYSGYSWSNSAADSSLYDDQEAVAEPPRKENNYGIEE